MVPRTGGRGRSRFRVLTDGDGNQRSTESVQVARIRRGYQDFPGQVGDLVVAVPQQQPPDSILTIQCLPSSFCSAKTEIEPRAFDAVAFI